MEEQKADMVNHPPHYTDGKYEVIDFIEDKRLGYHLGNAIKYISRAGKKDPYELVNDLKKAIWYLNRAIGTKDTICYYGKIQVEDYIEEKRLSENLCMAMMSFSVMSLLSCHDARDKKIRLMIKYIQAEIEEIEKFKVKSNF